MLVTPCIKFSGCGYSLRLLYETFEMLIALMTSKSANFKRLSITISVFYFGVNSLLSLSRKLSLHLAVIRLHF